MEPYLADLINNPKVPKIIRYIIVLIICGFIVFVGIATSLNSEMLWGKILGFLMVISILIVGIIMMRRIYKN